ncbi:MAG: hypothetical protein AB7N91_25175 [Candidatus Tectimicrobiota bacterium]
MAAERTTAEIVDVLTAQARRIWGDEDAARQRQALAETAAQITIVEQAVVPPDLEPRFL